MKKLTITLLMAGLLVSATASAQTYEFFVTNNTNAKDTGPWVSLQCKCTNWFSESFSGVFKQQPNEQMAYTFESNKGLFFNDFGTWICTAQKGHNNDHGFTPSTQPSTVSFQIVEEPHTTVHLNVAQDGTLTASVDEN